MSQTKPSKIKRTLPANNYLKAIALCLAAGFSAALNPVSIFAQGTGITNPAIGTWGEDPDKAQSGATFTTIIVHFWDVVIQVGALAVLLYFIWGAIEWVTSGGEKGKLETARNRMLHAAIGLLILVSAFVIINFVNFLLFGDQFDILRPVFVSPNGP